MFWLSFHAGHGELCVFFVSDIMELLAVVLIFVFKIFIPPPPLPQFSSASSALFSPLLQQSFLKNNWQHQGTQGTSGMCSSFTFSPLPQGKVCTCRVTLHFRKALLAFLIYVVLYTLCSWMEGGSLSDSH